MYKYYDIIDREHLKLSEKLAKIDSEYKRKQRILILSGIVLFLIAAVLFTDLLLE